ncbi:MAG: P1 family peptidase [Thermoanaerobacteraceae bacterium]|nr:P1 family peptidase [Thermoanaerobacteraceae bacterium]
MNGTITDVPGIKVGHFSDYKAFTGCTVVIAESGAVAGVDVRGSSPGTRETDLLHPTNLVKKIHAVLLTGGSAFGIDAAGGVMQYLEEKGIGFHTGSAIVPIVPAAVIYDLDVGDPSVRPDKKMGYMAARNSSDCKVEQGSVGVGTGASVGKIRGMEWAMKSGIGSYSIELGNGVIIGALSVVNALGDIYEDGCIIAGARNEDGSFLNTYEYLKSHILNSKPWGKNTTLSVVATNASLSKEEANKMAQVAHDGYSRVIKPVHTVYDGDCVFTMSTGDIEFDILTLCEAAAEVVEKAIINALKAAEGIMGLPSYSEIAKRG